MESDSAYKLSKKQNAVQMLRFALFSASAGIIQFISFTILSELFDQPYWSSYIPALALSVLYNFTINRHFTFKSIANIPLAMLKVVGYYMIFTPLSTWWGNVLTSRNWNEYMVLIFTMIINLITEYLFCRLVVYPKTMNTNNLAKKEIEMREI